MTRIRDEKTGSIEPEKPEPGKTFPGSRVRHGTTSGYNLHKELGDEPCNACAMAKAHYDWRWRSSDQNTRKNRLRAKAQALSLAELRRRHADEYDEIYRTTSGDVFREAGFDPPKVKGVAG